MISLGTLAENSLKALSALTTANRAVNQATERLATGEKINHAADDAAGMAMAARMQSQIDGLQQGIQNGLDGINLVRTADSILGDLIDIKQRMRERGMTDEQIDDSFRAQLVWDATMADSIARVRPNRESKVVHLVGQFHSDFEGGLVQALRHQAPATRVLVISMQDGDGRAHPSRRPPTAAATHPPALALASSDEGPGRGRWCPSGL